MDLSFYVLTVVIGGLMGTSLLLARRTLAALDKLDDRITALNDKMDAHMQILMEHERRITRLEVVDGKPAHFSATAASP